ncbi:MAG TPA: NAD(+) diphosphatase [Mycobacteriales bacterium]|nr:NAD(+) diphosphatase [Mycobacteriales bacterium]
MTLPAAVPVLSRHAVARGAAIRDDPDALDAAWNSPAARVLPITQDGLVPLRFGTLATAPPDSRQRPPDAFYLGADADGEWFAQVVQTPPRGRLAGLRDVGAELDDRDAGLVVHAVALANWHASHQHCPRCGTPTEIEQAGHSRRCPADGSQHFPRTDPAVIMLITDQPGDHVLFGRQAAWPAGRWSCLAGFVEAGESAEQAVARETAEETGVTVSAVRYVASQPWPFPASLMLGYRAEADPAQPVVVDGTELEDARWFPRQHVVDVIAQGLMLPPPVSIARHLVDTWLAEH